MKVKMNVWELIGGRYWNSKPDSPDDQWMKKHGYKFVGTTTIEVDPLMREVVREAEVECVGLYNRMTLLKGEVPTDSYDRKLVYKVKEPV